MALSRVPSLTSATLAPCRRSATRERLAARQRRPWARSSAAPAPMRRRTDAVARALLAQSVLCAAATRLNLASFCQVECCGRAGAMASEAGADFYAMVSSYVCCTASIVCMCVLGMLSTMSNLALSTICTSGNLAMFSGSMKTSKCTVQKILLHRSHLDHPYSACRHADPPNTTEFAARSRSESVLRKYNLYFQVSRPTVYYYKVGRYVWLL